MVDVETIQATQGRRKNLRNEKMIHTVQRHKIRIYSNFNAMSIQMNSEYRFFLYHHQTIFRTEMSRSPKTH